LTDRCVLHYLRPTARVRALVYAAIAVIVLALVVPPGCRRVRERVLLSLLRESERSVEVVAGAQPTFRFPPTAVRVVALIDYQDAARGAGHVSFVPPDGSDLYAWAVGVCPTWSTPCLESRSATTVSEITYGDVPAGLERIEPRAGRAQTLEPRRLYGLALFGDKLFALKIFYLDERGAHLMDGWRFAEAILRDRREDIRAFLGEPRS
jgi:hypothetical protein